MEFYFISVSIRIKRMIKRMTYCAVFFVCESHSELFAYVLYNFGL